jgi:NagD protein
MYTPTDLRHLLQRQGLNLTEDHIFTPAMATADFLKTQMPTGTAFVAGESGLTEALHQVGYPLTDRDPDYVVLGETTTFSYARLTQAVHLVKGGSRFIATIPDSSGPGQGGGVPGCGARRCHDPGGDGNGALLHWQAQPIDDPNGASPPGGTF